MILIKKAEQEMMKVSKNYQARVENKELAPHLKMARVTYEDKVEIKNAFDYAYAYAKNKGGNSK